MSRHLMFLNVHVRHPPPPQTASLTTPAHVLYILVPAFNFYFQQIQCHRAIPL